MAGNYISGKKKARSGSAPDPMVQDTPEIVGIVKSHLEERGGAGGVETGRGLLFA